MTSKVWMFLAVAALTGTLTRLRATPVVPQSPSETYTSVYNGWKWWHVYCYRCHGMNAVGSTLAPTLIDPNRRLTLNEFLVKVRKGNPDNGMQAWEQLLDNKQITQIYTYVRARADKVLPPGRPDEVGARGGPWVPPQGWAAQSKRK